MTWEPLEGQTVEFGDCRELLKQLEPGSVDLIYTDPPYRIKAHLEEGDSTFGVSSNEAYKYGVRVNKKGEPSVKTYGEGGAFVPYDEWLKPSVKALGNSGYLVVWETPKALGYLIPALIDAGLEIVQSIVWHVPNRQSFWQGQAKGKHDIAILCKIPGTKPPKGSGPIDCIRHASLQPVLGNDEGSSGVPGAKPIAVVESWVKWLCPEGGLVVDPFLGSGTTLLAAWMNNIRGVGFEIEEERKDVISQRLKSGQTKLAGLGAWC